MDASQQNRTLLIVFVGVVIAAFFCFAASIMGGLWLKNYLDVLADTQTPAAATRNAAAPTQAVVAATHTPRPNTTLEAQPTSDELANAQATAEFRRTATAVAQAMPDVSQWSVVLSETFTSNTLNWDVGTYEGDYADGNRNLMDGVYRWSAVAKEDVYWTISPDGEPEYTDFYLNVDVRILDAPTDADFGITFRKSTDDTYSGYYFGYTPSGKFTFQREIDGEWDTLIDWQTHSAIYPLGTNRLTVLADGNRLTFFINGQLVGALRDSRLKIGTVALSLALYNTDDEATVTFDNLEVRVKP